MVQQHLGEFLAHVEAGDQAGQLPAFVKDKCSLIVPRPSEGAVTGQTLHVDGGASIMDPVFPLDIQRG